ncbi:hypothetical protein OV079_39735 [Nannocystis pusilla]|uniref:Uncharacterized protein n=1 Tax=Nannocystis pusilla TaxID=889268 RepID=A0A9X3EY56_9BACT|nr:hypothetical protein [Nannocystis pusilla]MCY1011595.1 hypothetical protein [Nannocystis pusilla]
MRLAVGGALAVVGDPSRLTAIEPELQAARAAGVPVVLGSGGEPGGGQVSRLELAVSQARRAWFAAEAVINSRPLAEVRELLAAGRASRRRA